MTGYLEELTEGIRIARDVGQKVLRPSYGRATEVKVKNNATTGCREEIQASFFIMQRLEKVFPRHGITNEEVGQDQRKARGLHWIVDPLDSTHQYIHGLTTKQTPELIRGRPLRVLNTDPSYTVLMALMDGPESVGGIIYNPHTGEMIWAAKGEGTWLEEENAQTGEVYRKTKRYVLTSPELSLVTSGRRRSRNLEQVLSNIKHHWRGVTKLGASRRDIAFYHMSGTLKFAEVVKGTVNLAYQPPGNDVHIWDIAPLIPIVQEARGIIHDAYERPFDLLQPDFVLGDGVIVANRLYTAARLLHAQEGVYEDLHSVGKR